MRNLFCIVIPIYKEIPDPIEIISLNRLNKIIGEKNYDVYFITHEELNIEKYFDLYPSAKTKFFDKSFFESTKSYSYLCLSNIFYTSFNDYKKMFIYQTDCYLIYDAFDFYANMSYDYIGAPIFSNNCGWPTSKTDENGNEIIVPAVGNGGFSMRNIDTFSDITDLNGAFAKDVKLTDEMLHAVLWEDMFFCVDIKDFYDIIIPNYTVALSFAWDMSVDVIYDLWNIKVFPMCIHAWDKNIRFWQNHLPELVNNEEIINYCEEKHKEFFKLYYNERNETYR